MPNFASPPPHRPNRSAFWRESFYYLDVSGLPVKADSAATTAAIVSYHSARGLGTTLDFRPYGQASWNSGYSSGYYVDSLPAGADPNTARRTWTVNTPAAQQPGKHLYFANLRQQGATRNALGQYATVNFGDRHGVVWSEASDELMECIGYSGYSSSCMHNATYDLASYTLPMAANGVTPAGAIAPRFPVAPLFFTYQDLVDCGSTGNLGHMIGFVLQDYMNQRQWPSRGGDGQQTAGPKSGEVIRLRSDFNLASLPNDMMRALARTLQVHGAILFDRGDFPRIVAPNDPLWNTATRASFPFSQFECVDLSSVAGPTNSIRLATTTAGNLVPVAAFTYSPKSGAAPLTVTFNGTASADPDGSITSYVWDFGDGASGTGATTSHTYSTTGSFSPRLTVTDNLGSSASVGASGWVPRYPLDTPDGLTRFGVSNDSGVKVKWEDPISTPVSMFRRFFTWAQATNGNMRTEVLNNYTAGRSTWLSFKTPSGTDSWATVAAGTYQAQVDAFLVGLRDTGIAVWLTPYHEPENNVAPEAPGNGEVLSGTPAEWRAMVRYIEARRKAVGADNVLIVPVLMDYTFESGSGRTISDWMLPESDFPLYGFDPYTNSYGTSPARITNTRFNSAVSSMMTTYGKDLAIAECGGQIGSSAVRPPELWEAFAQECVDHNIKACCWFDVGSNDLANQSPGDPTGALYAAMLATFDSAANYNAGRLYTSTPVPGGSVEVSGTPVNVTPTARATSSASSGVPPTAISFSASGSTDPDGTIVSYAWNFGDSTAATGSSATHTFAANGVYTVTLTVTDNRGGTDTDTLTVRMSTPAVPSSDVFVIASARRVGSLGTVGTYARPVHSSVTGKIYWPPSGNTRYALELNPGNDSYRQIGDLQPSSTLWGDGFESPDGRIFWLAGANASPLLILDPVTGVLTRDASNMPGQTMQRGVISGTNIFSIGYAGTPTQVVKTNTETGSSSVVASVTGYYISAPIDAGNGYAYLIPYVSGATVQRMSLTDGTLTAATGPSVSSLRYYGGRLAPNGHIYAMPSVGTGILKIDPTTNAYELIHSSTGDRSVTAVEMTESGVMFGFNSAAATILRLDTNSDTLSTLTFSGGTFHLSEDRGSVLAGDRIFVFPTSNSGDLLMLDTVSGLVRRFGSGTVGGDGYGPPVLLPDLDRIYARSNRFVLRVGGSAPRSVLVADPTSGQRTLTVGFSAGGSYYV